MPVRKLRELLDEESVKYVVISHSPAYTAQEIAALAHVPGRELAKTVMVKEDEELRMAVLPASFQVDLQRLQQNVRAGTVELADEVDFRERFPDCEVGAMPPFGNLYGLRVYVDRKLAEDDEIAFNAGNHKELVRMAYKDFQRLAKPDVVDFARRPN